MERDRDRYIYIYRERERERGEERKRHIKNNSKNNLYIRIWLFAGVVDGQVLHELDQHMQRLSAVVDLQLNPPTDFSRARLPLVAAATTAFPCRRVPVLVDVDVGLLLVLEQRVEECVDEVGVGYLLCQQEQ